MSRGYDVAVLGLGAMGSAALYHAARAGLRAVGIDRLAPPHDQGSSHGGSRIIREAYFEDPCYVPLVQRAYLAWDRLERDAGETLRLTTGGVMIGPPDGVLVQGALASARTHGLAHELLDARALRARFPVFAPGDDMVGVWEPRAGVLFPERAVAAHLAGAARAGAELRLNDEARGWHADNDGVEVTTAGGRVRAERLVLAAGAWLPRLLQGATLPLQVERVVQAWFEPAPGANAAVLAPERCPITIWEYGVGRYFYAFPMLDGAVKAALHHQGATADPDRVRREIDAGEIARIREPLARHMPAANGANRAARTCLYSNTPDEHFVIDRHPAEPRVLIVSACSGHGFKFASAIGEVVVELLRDGKSTTDLARFGLARLRR